MATRKLAPELPVRASAGSEYRFTTELRPEVVIWIGVAASWSIDRAAGAGRAIQLVGMTKSRADSAERLQRARHLELAREQLAALSPGGSADRAIEVSSAAVIEVRAGAMPCPHCGGLYRVHEHTRPVPGLRRVDVACRYCGSPRALWFRIVDHEPN